jgi:DNA invertase Pin-like site-specific DNA recombinase
LENLTIALKKFCVLVQSSELFREKGVRFISIGDNYDSERGEDDFTPFREIISEWYARDCSRKVKAVVHAKGNSGKPLANRVYGYKKENDKWVVDEEAAAVVRRIFQMAMNGMGIHAIGRTLTAEKVEKPSAYFARTSNKTYHRNWGDPYFWSDSVVRDILEKLEYLGHTVNF